MTMSKFLKENGKQILIGLLISAVIGVFLTTLIIVTNNDNIRDECLRNVAEDYCESIDSQLAYVMYSEFYCIKDSGRILSDTYLFTKKETEMCRDI